MRLFIAVDLEGPVAEKVEGLMENLRKIGADLRFVDSRQVHITLKFLGEVDVSRVKGISESIRTALQGIDSFKLSIEGLGYFGSRNSPRVVWLGIGAGKQQLAGIMSRLEQSLAFIRREERESNPHLTIARARTARNSESLVQEIGLHKDVKAGEVDVKEIKLKQSIAGREGPEYSDIWVFRLGAS